MDTTKGRYYRKEHWEWEWEMPLGRGGVAKVKLQRCTDGDALAKQGLLQAVKIIEKTPNISKPLECHRELEAIAKFPIKRVRQAFKIYWASLTVTSV